MNERMDEERIAAAHRMDARERRLAVWIGRDGARAVRAMIEEATRPTAEKEVMPDGEEVGSEQPTDVGTGERLGVDPERLAQIIAHRVCLGVEHDPANGKLHGCCVVCGLPWPCAYSGPIPSHAPGARNE